MGMLRKAKKRVGRRKSASIGEAMCLTCLSPEPDNNWFITKCLLIIHQIFLSPVGFNSLFRKDLQFSFSSTFQSGSLSNGAVSDSARALPVGSPSGPAKLGPVCRSMLT